jgi:hypothetical protein
MTSAFQRGTRWTRVAGWENGIVLPMSKEPSIGQFLRSIFSDWSSGVSGGLSVPLTVLGIYLQNAPIKIVFIALAAIAYLASAYNLWRKERTDLRRLQDQLCNGSQSFPPISSRYFPASFSDSFSVG